MAPWHNEAADFFSFFHWCEERFMVDFTALTNGGIAQL